MNSLNLYRSLHWTAVMQRGRTAYYNKHKPVTDPAKQDPDYFENAARVLPMDENYIDQLGKLYYDKVASERDLGLKAADNLVADRVKFGLPEVNLSAPRFPYNKIDILNTAPESVKRVFSIELGSRHDLSTAWKTELIKSVQKHSLDNESTEMKIAWLTAMIRHWSLLVDDMRKQKPDKPVYFTHRIWLFVNFRRKLLRLLREKDEEAFDRVVKELKISYHVQKQPEHVKTRKAWAEHQLRLRVEEEKEKRLTALHQSYMDKREEKVQQIEERKKKLEEENNKAQSRLKELLAIEGNVEPKDKYEPSLVSDLTEITIHNQLFYHEKPNLKAYD